MLTLREMAHALGGEVAGGQVLCPGPGHSARDRSLSVRLSDTSPDGFIVHSHAGDDWRICREHVAAVLGLSPHRWRNAAEIDPAEIERRAAQRRAAEERHRQEAVRKQRFASRIWEASRDPRGTVVESYLKSRGLELPDAVAVTALRFHPACPWEGNVAPAMVAALRDVRTGEIVGVHRTRLSLEGRKLGRKMFGTASNAAIMLDQAEMVGTSLAIGEGIETCLAARQLDLGPVWAVGSTAGIAGFPVLPSIETLNLLAENDRGASEAAVQAVGTRWYDAGRAVIVCRPRVGKDMNDALLGRNAA